MLLNDVNDVISALKKAFSYRQKQPDHGNIAKCLKHCILFYDHLFQLNCTEQVNQYIMAHVRTTQSAHRISRLYVTTSKLGKNLYIYQLISQNFFVSF